MARNTTLPLTAGQWLQITDADVSSITFQNVGPYGLAIKATTDGTAPTGEAGTARYNPGAGERNVLLSDLFPGIPGANRVWAFCESPSSVFVSHA